MRFSPAMEEYLKAHQREFMSEDTKAGIIQSYLDGLATTQVCFKQIYAEALGHAFDEPRQWEIREINDIMNNTITGWRPFSNPRIFGKYGRQKGWERGNGLPATDEKKTDGFIELTEEEVSQMEFPF